MIHPFDNLNEQEVELMLKTPILVSILVAGADGSIDRKEISEAASFLEKQSKVKSPLVEYFREVAQDFEDKFKVVLQEYPHDYRQRNIRIVEDLSRLNSIFPKMQPEFTIQLYKILKAIAFRIASSSGGLLGMKAIDEEEAKYLELSMIEDPTERSQ